jgi:guanylate kinase
MTKPQDDAVTDAAAPPPLLEPEHVSDDPGRPDTTILGAPGAMLVIISGPSGVGKDTIIDEMRRRESETGRVGDRHYVVTMTTRAPRDGEVDGVDYNFVSRQEFLHIRADRGFLEANELYGNWYGSPRQQVRDALFDGKDVILKIDVQGAQIVKEQVTESLLIFIIPPTLETLISRLRARATETADELDVRQQNAAIELARQGDYDHVVVNETGKVGQTADRIESIIAAERAAHVGRRVRV